MPRCEAGSLLGFRDFRSPFEFRFLRVLHRFRLFDARLFVRFGRGDIGIALHLSDSRFPERFEIAVLVTNIFDCERDDDEAHLGQIL